MKASLNIKLDLSISISCGRCEACRVCGEKCGYCVLRPLFLFLSFNADFAVDFLKKLEKQLFCLFTISRKEISAYKCI